MRSKTSLYLLASGLPPLALGAAIANFLFTRSLNGDLPITLPEQVLDRHANEEKRCQPPGMMASDIGETDTLVYRYGDETIRVHVRVDSFAEAGTDGLVGGKVRIGASPDPPEFVDVDCKQAKPGKPSRIM